VAALFGYLLVAFFYLGLGPLVESGRQYVGHAYNPQIFIWAFAWWPHAILHGQNPFFTHAVWSPVGANTMWSTTVPGLALVFAPLTLLVGPILSYDVAAVLMPALAAWTGFLLCRYLTGKVWPSILGGYLFGFSSYVLAEGGAGGNLNLSSIFLLPLAALVVLRFLDARLDGRGLVVRFGPLIAFQFLLSAEVALTLTLALAVSLGLCLIVAPARRARVRCLLAPLGVAYLLAGLVTAPFLYYLLTGIPDGSFYAPNSFIADLANYVVPTRVTAAAGGWLTGVSDRFPGNLGEQGAYLGLPIVVIIVLFARERLRTAGGRFLLAALVIGVVVALGGRATAAGHALGSMPWALVQGLPLIENLLTTRLVVYVELVAAVIVALWTAGRGSGLLRFILPGLAVVAIVPDPHAGGFATTYRALPFFTEKAFRGCLDHGETVLPLPFRGDGEGLLWQAESGFRFRLAGGDIGPDIPASFLAPAAILPITGGSSLGPDQVDAVRAFAASKGVTSIVVDGSRVGSFSGALDPIAPPKRVGGVVVYRLERYPPPCP
jgi:hypothetical protein